MASTFSTNLRIELIGAGEQSGAWNNTTNTNLGTLIEQAICGVQTIVLAGSDYTLEAANGASDESRNMVLVLTGTPGASRNVIAPDVDKVYIVRNETAYAHTIKTASGSGVSVPANSSALVFSNSAGSGTFYNAVEDLAAGASIAGAEIVTTSGTQTLTNKTLTAPKFADLGFIADANGNELIVMDTTTSAVNEVTVANAATGNGPTISSSGSDTNINLNLTAKGTGVVNLNSSQVISVTDNTNAALRVTQLGTGNALLVEDSANPDATPFAIDASGKALFGYTASITGPGATAGLIQLNGIPGYQQIGWDASNYPYTTLGRSRSATIGTHTIVQSGDTVGALGFVGSDGTNFIPTASIESAVDGTPGTNDMPGRIVFSTTADGAASATERFRIGSAGQLGIGGANYGTSGQVLTSGGASAAPSWQTLSSASGLPDVIVEDQKTSGTGGGTATVGAWTTRTLNTLYRNNGSIASLASNEVTLPVGTYYITVRSPFYYTGSYFRLRLYNVTSSSVERLGYNAYANSGNSPDRPNQFDATLEAIVTVSGSSKAFRVEYYIGNLQNSNTSNLGFPSGLGTEFYTSMNIWKLA